VTGYGLVASLAWTVLGAALLWRADVVATRWMRGREPAEMIEIPPDLMALALNETEEWAQTQTMKVLREKYAEYHDWNRVRAAVGVATIHELKAS
jgi:hypothetical protein